jgi:hypothetical protein
MSNINSTTKRPAQPGDPGAWSIGDPNNPSLSDAMCGTEQAALDNAKAISADKVVAVWDGPTCAALCFEGSVWRRN